MRKLKSILVFVLLILALLLPETVSAQRAQTYPAAGSLESYGKGLWSYYKGKSKTWVKSHAPVFREVSTNKYILDAAEISDVELYLMAEFKNNKVAVLQILTPYPDYKKCNDEIKELSYNFGTVGMAFMGVTFDVSEECKLVDGNIICIKDKTACVLELCPEEMGAFACTNVN